MSILEVIQIKSQRTVIERVHAKWETTRSNTISIRLMTTTANTIQPNLPLASRGGADSTCSNQTNSKNWNSRNHSLSTKGLRKQTLYQRCPVVPGLFTIVTASICSTLQRGTQTSPRMTQFSQVTTQTEFKLKRAASMRNLNSNYGVPFNQQGLRCQIQALRSHQPTLRMNWTLSIPMVMVWETNMSQGYRRGQSQVTSTQIQITQRSRKRRKTLSVISQVLTLVAQRTHTDSDWRVTLNQNLVATLRHLNSLSLSPVVHFLTPSQATRQAARERARQVVRQVNRLKELSVPILSKRPQRRHRKTVRMDQSRRIIATRNHQIKLDSLSMRLTSPTWTSFLKVWCSSRWSTYSPRCPWLIQIS